MTYSKEQLRGIFQSQFSMTDWQNLLKDLFDVPRRSDPYSDNLGLDPSTGEGYKLGSFLTPDHYEVGCYYYRLNGNVDRRRVSLRNLVSKHLKIDADAALAVFDGGDNWRFSFVCNLRGDSTSPKRFSYVLGDSNNHYRTPVDRVAELQRKGITFNNINEAFSVDALSKDFFDEYHRQYDRICDHIIHSHINTLSHIHIHDYVKKMMGRIVFLHFLQKKGWLNGDTNFMQNTFANSRAYRDDYLEKVLEPLFFGMLNTQVRLREKVFRDNGWDFNLLKKWSGDINAIPYLNGGLFERDEVDRLNIKLPASLFEDLFDFLASYNFTVDENDPDDAEVGVDPEMLGKIFESLLEDNKTKGAFYTPKEIVRYMCKESLIAYLDSKLESTGTTEAASERHNARSANNPTQEKCGECDRREQTPPIFSQCGDVDPKEECVLEVRDLKTAIRTFVEQHEMQPELEPYRDTLDAALRSVKICDPAIGSGAFPMGLLNELWRCREALMDAADTSERCDFNNTVRSAVTSTKTSMRAGGTRHQTRVELKKEIIENNIYGVDIERGAIDIARLRFWLSIVVDAEEPELLPNFDYKFMQGNSLIESFEGFDLSHISNRLRGGQPTSRQLVIGLDSHLSRQNLQRFLREYFSVTNHQQKTGMRQAINEEVKTLIRESIGGTPTSLAKLEKMDCSANQDFFLWHTWFKDIFDKGGFDIVIANPPYISAIEAKKTIDDFVRQQYKKTYITASGTYDIYVIFIELGFKLLRNDGILSYITPSKYLSAEYAKTLREFIIKYYSVELISDFSSIRVFENAGVSTMISTFRKCKQRNTVRFESFKTTTEIESFHVYNKSVLSLLPNNLWGALLSNQIDLFLKIHFQSVTMEEFSEVNACSTAAEAEEYENSLISEFNSNAFMYINNGTINRYVHYWGQKEIRSKKILTPYLPFTALNSRRKNMFKKEKLIFVKLARCPQVFLDERGEFASANTNMVYDVKQYNYKFLLGYFNSKLFDYVYKTMFGGNSMLGSIQVQAPQIRKSLIPKPSLLVKQQQIIDIVEEILQEKRISPNTDTTALEQQIDQLVYQLYNLTPEEIAVIEQ